MVPICDPVFHSYPLLYVSILSICSSCERRLIVIKDYSRYVFQHCSWGHSAESDIVLRDNVSIPKEEIVW